MTDFQHNENSSRLPVKFRKFISGGFDWIGIYDSDVTDGTIALDSDQVRLMCNRTNGIGASGVVLVVGNDPADLWLLAYGADGQQLTERTVLLEPAKVAAHLFTAHQAELQGDAPGTTYEPEPVTVTCGQHLIEVYMQDQLTGVDAGGWAFVAAQHDPQAVQAGADCLVMAEGLADPRPGLTVAVGPDGQPCVIVALSDLDELGSVSAHVAPGIDPEPEAPVATGFVVMGQPVFHEGVGQLTLGLTAPAKQFPSASDDTGGRDATAGNQALAATVAVRHWAQADTVPDWRVRTPKAEFFISFNPHDPQDVSVWGSVHEVFSGKLAKNTS